MNTIFTFLNFRLKQAWRFIQEVGLPLLLIFFVVTIGITSKGLVALSQIEGYEMGVVSLFLVGSIHMARKDYPFLKSLNINKPLLLFFEYGLMILPVSIILLLMGKIGAILFWHLGVLPVLLLPMGSLKRGNSTPLFSYHSIPIKYFELRTGLRKSLIGLGIFYVAALACSFFNGTLVLWSLLLVMIIPMFFEYFEPKEMLEPVFQKGNFLQKKVIQHLLIFQITLLPHYILFLYFHSKMWYLALACFIGISLSIIFSIVYKYSNYRPHLPKIFSNTFHAVFLGTLVMPGFVIVSIGLIIYFWRFVENYSTGMKKKLAFIGVIAMDRPILILDEPFNGVDIESNEKILQLLIRLKSTNKIIIIASHIIESLTRICDKINLLENGVIKTTYEKNEFSILENELKDKIKLKIDEALDGLI